MIFSAYTSRQLHVDWVWKLEVLRPVLDVHRLGGIMMIMEQFSMRNYCI